MLREDVLDGMKTSEKYQPFFDKKSSVFNESSSNEGKISFKLAKTTSFYRDFTNTPNNLNMSQIQIKSNVKYPSKDSHENCVVSKFQSDSNGEIGLSGDNPNNEG